MADFAGLCLPIEELEGFSAVADRFNVKEFYEGDGRPQSGEEEHTVNNMLFWSKVNTGVSNSREKYGRDATTIFDRILEYMTLEETDVSLVKKVELAQKVIDDGMAVPWFRDEIYLQLIKQTRRNPDPASKLRAWELLHLVTSTMPPSKDFVQLVTEYIQLVSNSEVEEQDVREVATKSWVSLKRVVQLRRREYLLSAAEIGCFLTGQKLTCTIFYLDGTFQEILCEMTTTVSEAMKQLADITKLQNYQSFTLFMCRETIGATQTEDDKDDDEHIMLDDDRYVADALAACIESSWYGKAIKGRLIVKKKLFKETDESISESQFIYLCFVQIQYDYLQGSYPVVKEDAAQLCALQAFAEHGSVIFSKEDELMHTLQEYIPKHACGDYTPEGWLQAVTSWSQVHGQSSKERARLHFLRILRNLPYGHSIFFHVKKVEDPIGLLPNKLILGINKRGIHFFARFPRQHFHSIDLRDIMYYNSDTRNVFFKLRFTGVFHMFQFKTEQGEEICLALRTHISDMMMKRCSEPKVSVAETIPSDHDEAIEGGGESSGIDAGQESLGSESDESAENPQQIDLSGLCHETKVEKLNQAIRDAEKSRDLQLEQKQAQLQELRQRRLSTDDRYNSRRKEFEQLQSDFIEYADQHKALTFFKYDQGSDSEEIPNSSSLPSSQKSVEGLSLTGCEVEKKIDTIVARYGLQIFEGVKQLETHDCLEFEHECQKQEVCIKALKDQFEDTHALHKKYSTMVEELNGKIKTVVRLSPLDQNGDESQIQTLDGDTISLPQGKMEEVDPGFVVDAVCTPNTTTHEIFESVKGMCESAIQGYNVHVVSLGTQNSGKTKTLFGTDVDSGFIIKAVDEILRLRASDYTLCDVSLEWSMMILQNDQLTDLLATDHKKLVVKHDLRGLVHVVNLEFQKFESLSLLNGCINDTLVRQKHIGHDTSSSSFFVTINIRCFDKESSVLRQGRMVFSDLVGFATDSSPFTALSDVVEALCEDTGEVPYTACTLTKLLSDCFGGNAKTLVIAHVNPKKDLLHDIRRVLELVTSLREIRNVVSRCEMNKRLLDVKEKLAEAKRRRGVPDCLLDAIDMLDVTDEPLPRKLKDFASCKLSYLC